MPGESKRSRPVARIADKIAEMPFGRSLSDDFAFPISDLLRDRRWVLIPEDEPQRQRKIAYAKRDIQNALRFYSANSERLHGFDRRQAIEKALRTNGHQLLKVLNKQTNENTDTALHDAISSLADDDERHLQNLHVALKEICKGLELSASASRDVQARSPAQQEALGLRKGIKTSARKSVAKMADPAGHMFAFKLVRPFMMLSGKEPSGVPHGLFAAFVERIEAAYLARLEQRLREANQDASDEKLALEIDKHRILKRHGAVRWAVGQWKSERRQT